MKQTTKDTITVISVILMILSVIALVANLAGNIGYALYLWSHDHTLAVSLWAAFVLWCKVLVGSLVVMAIAALTNASVE